MTDLLPPDNGQIPSPPDRPCVDRFCRLYYNRLPLLRRHAGSDPAGRLERRTSVADMAGVLPASRSPKRV